MKKEDAILWKMILQLLNSYGDLSWWKKPIAFPIVAPFWLYWHFNRKRLLKEFLQSPEHSMHAYFYEIQDIEDSKPKE